MERFSLDDIDGDADGGEAGFIVAAADGVGDCGFAKAEDSSVEDMIATKAKGAQLKLVQSARLRDRAARIEANKKWFPACFSINTARVRCDSWWRTWGRF